MGVSDARVVGEAAEGEAMTVDREQTRRDAEAMIARNEYGQTWARRWLALLAELEEAERERDEARIEISRLGRTENWLNDKLTAVEARLAKVPALVEALRDIVDSTDGMFASDRAFQALAAWEQDA